jgi:hypothetical protein
VVGCIGLTPIEYPASWIDRTDRKFPSDADFTVEVLNIMISISAILAESGSRFGQGSVKTSSLNGLDHGSLTDAGWNQ